MVSWSSLSPFNVGVDYRALAVYGTTKQILNRHCIAWWSNLDLSGQIWLAQWLGNSRYDRPSCCTIRLLGLRCRELSVAARRCTVLCKILSSSVWLKYQWVGYKFSSFSSVTELFIRLATLIYRAIRTDVHHSWIHCWQSYGCAASVLARGWGHSQGSLLTVISTG